MVKLTGPVLGQGASGALAESVIFSNSKGRSYAKTYRKPKQPRSQPQVAMRAAMSWLSSQWPNVLTAFRATWLPAANAARISTFNAYQAANLTRLRNDQAPSVFTPPTGTGSGPLIANWQVLDGVRSLTIRFNISNARQGWGISIYNVATTGVQPTWQKLVHVTPAISTGWFDYTWPQTTPGTYWFTFRTFTGTGGFSGPAGYWYDGIVSG